MPRLLLFKGPIKPAYPLPTFNLLALLVITVLAPCPTGFMTELLSYQKYLLVEIGLFTLIEGMTIAAVAVGATQGFVYLRSEYPTAITRLRDAIAIAEGAGVAADVKKLLLMLLFSFN